MDKKAKMQNESSITEILRLIGVGSVDKAILDVEKILKTSPINSDALRARALINMHRALYADAECDLRAAILHSTAPNSSYLLDLGEVLIRRGKFREAADRLECAVAIIKEAENNWEISMTSFMCAFAHAMCGQSDMAQTRLQDVDEGIFFFENEVWNKQKLMDAITQRGATWQSESGST